MLDIQECLNKVYFPIFTLSLGSLGHAYQKKSRGTIWIDIEATKPFLKLKKEIHKQLQKLSIKNKKTPFSTNAWRITLGKYHQVPEGKLGSYLESNTSFYHPSFTVDAFNLFSFHRTQTKLFYTEE